MRKSYECRFSFIEKGILFYVVLFSHFDVLGASILSFCREIGLLHLIYFDYQYVDFNMLIQVNKYCLFLINC